MKNGMFEGSVAFLSLSFTIRIGSYMYGVLVDQSLLLFFLLPIRYSSPSFSLRSFLLDLLTLSNSAYRFLKPYSTNLSLLNNFSIRMLNEKPYIIITVLF